MEKYLTWIKSNYITLIFIIAAAYFAWRFLSFDANYKSFVDMQNKQTELVHKQIKDLENVNKALKENQDKLQKQYEEDVRNIRMEYDEKITELYKLRKETQIKIIRDTRKDPTNLTNKITEVFGIPVENN